MARTPMAGQRVVIGPNENGGDTLPLRAGGSPPPSAAAHFDISKKILYVSCRNHPENISWCTLMAKSMRFMTFSQK